MSNEVYGYVKSPNITDTADFFKKNEESLGIGIQEISIEELYNFPEGMLPKANDKFFAFIVGDRPGKTNASYLTDYMDYSNEADIGLPRLGVERLNLLVEFFESVISRLSPDGFAVAITESNQVDFVKEVYAAELRTEIYKDFEFFQGSPDCIYSFLIDKL